METGSGQANGQIRCSRYSGDAHGQSRSEQDSDRYNKQINLDVHTPVDADIDADDHDESAEPTVVKRRSAPFQPSPEEVDDHEAAGHTPFCACCVEGASRSDAHRREDEQARLVPTVALD